MFEIIFIAAIGLYFIQTIIFTIGLNKSFNKLDDDDLPTATVIVAARNEEDKILRCLESLNNLEYPDAKLEIVIVNDNSTDNTQDVIEKFIKDKEKFKCITPSKQFGEVKGKANAIANAIEITKGEIILTTDADCEVNPLWAKTICSYYEKDVALVCGFTDQLDDTLFKGMQAVDFIYLLSVASGSINLNWPLSCIGNNMSYRRQAYNDVGGYAAIPFSVTEDFKLLFAIFSLKKYRIIYPLDRDSLVISETCEDVKTLFRQKQRWGVGGLDSKISNYPVMITAYLVHLGFLLAPFLGSINSLYFIFFKLVVDYFFLKPVYDRLERKFKLKNFLVFEIYFIIYVLTLPFVLLFNRNVVWKDRKF